MDNSVRSYCQENQYPSCSNNQDPIDLIVKDNNINLKIDRLYYCVINNQMDFYNELSLVEKQEFMEILKNLEFDYNKNIAQYFSKDNEIRIKTIIYFLMDAIKQKKPIPQNLTMRASLIYIYDKCRNKEIEYKNSPNEIINFYDYYYKSVMLELYKN